MSEERVIDRCPRCKAAYEDGFDGWVKHYEHGKICGLCADVLRVTDKNNDRCCENKELKYEGTNEESKPIHTMVDASQWVKHGDHPKITEYIHPWGRKNHSCLGCHKIMAAHGWTGENTVCPGDWVVTFSDGKIYSVKPDMFNAIRNYCQA